MVDVHLRPVRLTDRDVYVRMRTDPVMMAELGGPLPRDGLDEKLAQDVAAASVGAAWVEMIVLDEEAGEPGAETVAGAVVVWMHEQDGELVSEMGWMVLPEFQGRGLATAAVRALLDRARGEGHWGVIHAYPAVTNGPSNGVCRATGFTLMGQRTISFADRPLHVNDWRVRT